jgi:hypothetical protein
MSKHSHELPEEILDRLRRIVTIAGNKKGIDKDPVKVLTMLLYGIEEGISLDDGDIKYLIVKYCSADGIARRSHRLQEKNVA